MRTSQRIWVLLGAWLLAVIGVGGAVAQAAPGKHDTTATGSATSPAGLDGDIVSWLQTWLPTRSSQPSCPATGIAGSATPAPSPAFERYFHDDWRLGPRVVPRVGPVGELLRGYHRTDSMSPQAFLDCYWDPTAGGVGGWRYPPNQGFADGSTPIKLDAGQYLDRFGPNSGRFLSPYGTPYAERALPPSNLDTYEERYPNNYHVFLVLKPFTVDGGEIAPWFGQPGGGLQYLPNAAYLPDAMPGERIDTQWLLDHDYIQAVN